MKRFLTITLIILSVVSCNTDNNDDITPNQMEFNHSKTLVIDTSKLEVTFIKPDSLTVIRPGENNEALSKTIAAGKPKVSPYHFSSLPAGVPSVQKIDHSKLKILTPGKNGLSLPKTYKIPNSAFTIEDGDTIFAPKTTLALHSEPIPALPARYKENAILDMKYLNEEQGFPFSYTYSVCQDKNENMWFGFYNGNVMSYNGVSFINLILPSEKENVILDIIDNKKGGIWIATLATGIYYYNGKSLVNFRTSQKLLSNSVRKIFEDSKGNLWIGTDKGLSCYDGKSVKNFTKKEGLISNSIWSIYEDKKGNIWIGTDKGVCFYNGKSFAHFSEVAKSIDGSIFSIYEDSNSSMWFGTLRNGVSCYDGKTITNYTKDENLADNIVRDIFEDNSGKMWFATHGGLSCFDGNAFTNYTEKEGLSSNIIPSIYESRNGDVWLTGLNGVNILNTQSFKTVMPTGVLPENFVYSTTTDKNGNSWMSTSQGAKYCNGQNIYTYGKAQGLANIVYNSIDDKKGNILFFCNGYLSSFNGKTFTKFYLSSGFDGYRTSNIIVDKNKKIWFGLYNTDHGLYCFDGEVFTKYTKKDGLADDNIISLFEDEKGRLWIGTEKEGLCCFNGLSFTNYTKENGLPDNTVYSITEDKNKNIWLATDKGLACMSEDSIVHYTTKNGLQDNKILSIINDTTGNLWLTSISSVDYLIFDTLVRKDEEINNKPSSFREFRIQHFENTDGLKALNQYDIYDNDVHIDNQNQIWWENNINFITLDLNTFKPSVHKPKIQLNRIELQEMYIDYHLWLDSLPNSRKKNAPIAHFDKVYYTEASPYYNYPINLSLPYNVNTLGFNFSATDWDSPHQLKYRFILKGNDKNWSVLTEKTEVTYRNLSPGNYTFKVQAIGVAKKWSEIFEYQFTVRPPWWLSWWAKTIWTVLFTTAIFLIYFAKIRALKKRQFELEQQVEQRTHEISKKNINLEQQKEEILTQTEQLQIQNDKLIELDNFKQGMTSMIVHDLKNPLNAIINTPNKYNKDQKLEIKTQYGKQMLNLVMNILDVNKYEETHLKVDLQTVSLFQISVNAIEQIQFLANQKNIEISNTIAKNISVKAENETIERVFVNILTNAIKYSEQNSNILLEAEEAPYSTKDEHDSYLKIKITDSGIGIPNDKQHLVFQKFGQVVAKKSGNVRSTGIGLTFCKMAIEAHGGEINFTNEADKGTCFWFTLQQSELGSNTDNNNASETNTSTKSKIVLTLSDEAYLEPFITKLKKHELYEITEIQEIVDKIENKSENIKSWKEELIKIIDTFDDKRFLNLLK